MRFEKNPFDLAAAATVEPHRRWLQETQHRLACRAIWQKYFESHDVFLLPAGIQIVAPMWEDATSIEFAALLAELVGGFTEPPAFRE